MCSHSSSSSRNSSSGGSNTNSGSDGIRLGINILLCNHRFEGHKQWARDEGGYALLPNRIRTETEKTKTAPIMRAF
jgi:hypothetical protein